MVLDGKPGAASVIVQPVVLCHDRALEQGWFHECARSWSRLQGCDSVTVLDGGLAPANVERLAGLGLWVFDPEEGRERIHWGLEPYPHLRRMREEHVLFRKLVDPTVLFSAADKILLMDSDIHVYRPVTVPTQGADITYMVDDVSGYAGSWRMPLKLPMVLGLNSGFVLYNPRVVDFALLDELCREYFLEMPGSGRWWAEQAAWSVMAGRARSRAAFDGRQCVIVNGGRRRTAEEIWANKTKWIGRMGVLTDSGFYRLMETARVIHFAGGGRDWITRLPKTTEHDSLPEHLRTGSAGVATSVQKVFLAGRLGMRRYYKEGGRILRRFGKRRRSLWQGLRPSGR